MTTRGARDSGNATAFKVKTSTTPVVSIKRIPALDEAAAALSSTYNVDVASRGNWSCFLCGGVTLLASMTQGRRHYLRQIQLFKTYLSSRQKCDYQNEENELETCAKCRQDVKEIWDLNEQIEAIREDIMAIVDRVSALKPKNGGATVSTRHGKRDKKKNTCRGSGPLSKRTKNEESKADNNEDLIDFDPGPDHEANDPLLVEVKEESVHAWSGDEDGNPIDEASCFEKLDVAPPQSQSEINIRDQLANSESVVTSSSPIVDSSLNDSLRPKRKSKLRAEERLRETSQEKVCDEDDHSEYEGGDPLAMSEPDEEAESESGIIEDPPNKKKKRIKKQLISHNKTDTNPPPYKCQFCERSFIHSRSRTKHVNFAHKGIAFPCSLCSMKLMTEKQWAIHEATVCMIPDKGWGPERLKNEFNLTLLTCPVEGCGKLSCSKQNMTSHMNSHNGSAAYLCSTCGSSFARPESFKKHCATVCGPGLVPERRRSEAALAYEKREKPFSCLLCFPPRRFVKSDSLSTHNLQFHPLSKGNSSTDSLVRCQPPKRTRNFPCPNCENRFYNSYERDRHVTTYHDGNEDGQRKFICKDCGNAYRYRSNLCEHRAIIHPDAATRKYTCDKCPRRFYKLIDLQKHVDIHAKYGY